MDYSNAEIINALREMGFLAPEEDALSEIRSKLSSTSFPDEIDDSELLTNFLAWGYPQIEKHFRKNDSFVPEIPKEYADLLDDAFAATSVLRNGIQDIDQTIQALLADLPEDLIRSFHDEISTMNRSPSPPSKPVQQMKSAPEESRPKLKDFEFDDENNPLPLRDEVEKEMIKEVCRQRALTHVECPPPGRAPFKHDPVARNQQYQEVWKQFPVPGQKRRKALRWKIRELMLRRDIPRLKLIPNPRLQPRIGLKPWND